MTFTNKNLKQLKNCQVWNENLHWLPALIARLEAAEAVVQGLSCGSREDMQIELEAWRKAAGRAL